MNPYHCIHSKVECNASSKEDEPHVTQVDNMQLRLVAAAEFAKLQLQNKKGREPAIEVKDHSKTSIIIDIIEDTILIIYQSGNVNEPLFREHIHTHRYIYFSDLKECRIFIRCKVLGLMFQKCSRCQVSLRAPVIGMTEFYDCDTMNLNIRVAEDEGNSPMPLIRIEMCEKFRIFQSVETLVYVIKLCANVTGTIVDQRTGERKIQYNLGRLFWNEHEQNLVCLSKSEGFASLPINYTLNELTHHVILRPKETEEDLTGSSPQYGSPIS